MRRYKKNLKALFCAKLSHSHDGYTACKMVWCGICYIKVTLDRIQVNYPMDEYGNLIYDCKSDASRYKVGMYGSHLMGTFQWDLCVFRTLYHRNPIQVIAYGENIRIIRNMNLDAIWYR